MNEIQIDKKETNNKEFGNFMAIFVIVGVLLAGGVYAFFKVQEYAYPEPSNIKVQSGRKILQKQDPVLNSPESKSINPEDIEQDINLTDLETLEHDLNTLDQI